MSNRRRARAGLSRRPGLSGAGPDDGSVRGVLAARYRGRAESVAEDTGLGRYYRARLESVLSGGPVHFAGWELRGRGLDNRRSYILTGADTVARR